MTTMRLSRSYRDAIYLVTFALSLVLFLSAALFASVGFNKKSDDYGNLPWFYSIGCLTLSVVLWFVSRVFMESQEEINLQEIDDSVASPFTEDTEAIQVNGQFKN
ncbi:MAG: hypothetical protein ACFCD0_03490 [Gemmataceae bacterium]